MLRVTLTWNNWFSQVPTCHRVSEGRLGGWPISFCFASPPHHSDSGLSLSTSQNEGRLCPQWFHNCALFCSIHLHLKLKLPFILRLFGCPCRNLQSSWHSADPWHLKSARCMPEVNCKDWFIVDRKGFKLTAAIGAMSMPTACFSRLVPAVRKACTEVQRKCGRSTTS